MFKCSFTTLEELNKFLLESDYGEVKFCVDPDYVDAIIGISDESKIVYDFDRMVEHLANIYKSDEDIDDPYSSASEWIEYNCQIPYWEVVYTLEDDSDLYEYGEEFPEQFSDYTNAIIGINNYGVLLLDSEHVKVYNIDDIEGLLNKYNVSHKII